MKLEGTHSMNVLFYEMLSTKDSPAPKNKIVLVEHGTMGHVNRANRSISHFTEYFPSL